MASSEAKKARKEFDFGEMDKDVKKDWLLPKNSFKERLKQLLSLSRWTDCAFQVGHDDVQVIHAHKLVLGVSSPVFEALFYGPLACNNDEIISVPDIEPNTFRTFLEYLYSEEVVIGSIEEAGELLYTAKKYLVQPLAENCKSYIIQQTFIKTLWDVLVVAEALSEEKLLSACLKVMCRYQYEIWRIENENLSASTLQKLLEQDEMNMCETELWYMVLDWARKELESRGLLDTPQARRKLIEDAGLISKIRFLTIPPQDLDQLVGVLSEHEVEALKTQRDIPPLFSRETSVRGQARALVWKSARDLVCNRNQLWVNHGEVVCKISSTSRVLVIGFEVFTRVAHSLDFIRRPSESSYREKLVVFVKDPDGNVIQKTDYVNTVKFNTSQIINLERPMWFEPNVKYTVNIGLIGGQYPVCKYNDGTSRGTSFYFEEVVLLQGCNKLPSTFIISVLYAL